jgi:hypothetical protein
LEEAWAEAPILQGDFRRADGLRLILNGKSNSKARHWWQGGGGREADFSAALLTMKL